MYNPSTVPLDLLSAVGAALYGPQWQRPLARALGVSERNMRYWVAGRPIPDIRNRLTILLHERRLSLAALEQALAA